MNSMAIDVVKHDWPACEFDFNTNVIKSADGTELARLNTVDVSMGPNGLIKTKVIYLVFNSSTILNPNASQDSVFKRYYDNGNGLTALFNDRKFRIKD